MPSFHCLSSTAPKTDYNTSHLYAKTVLNILIVGLKSGLVHTYVFGVLPCGRIDIGEAMLTPPYKFEIIETKMSINFQQILIFIRCENVVKMLQFENELFPIYSVPLLNIATKHGYILNTLS